MKLLINKSKDGKGYYTTIKNNFNGEEIKMYIPLQLKKGLEVEYGLYDVNCFISCYKANDGQIKPKIVVMGIKEEKRNKTSITPEEIDQLFGGDYPFD